MSAIPAAANVFAELDCDRMAEFREDASWLAAQGQRGDARFLLLDDAGRALATADLAAPDWLRDDQCTAGCGQPSFLGMADGVPYFCAAIEADATGPEQSPKTRWLGLREAGNSWSAFDAGLFAYAAGLSQWQARHRYCPACGEPLQYKAAGHRAECSACGRLEFPRTDPAIIVCVEHDGACLLGRQAGWPAGRYSTLAGFVEPGEALEDAVRREVAEEAGVEVDECHYHSSQPWPFPASLMIGFHARARGRTIHLRDGELEDARWFRRAQLAEALRDGTLKAPSPLSVSYRLLDEWMTAGGAPSIAQLAPQR